MLLSGIGQDTASQKHNQHEGIDCEDPSLAAHQLMADYRYAKILIDGFSTFGNMTSQKFPFQNETSHWDSIFTCWIQAKLDKNHFMPENIFPGINFYPPPAFP